MSATKRSILFNMILLISVLFGCFILSASVLTSIQQAIAAVLFQQNETTEGGGVVSGNKNLAPGVLSKQDIVKRYLIEAGIPEELPYLLAIMMVESRGEGNDPMQSSESLGLPPGSLGVEDSIRQGVFYYKAIMETAQAAGIGDEKKAIVQSYNFGSGYISWLARKQQRHSIDIAEKFSKEVLAPALGNFNASKYSYVNEVSKADGRTYLYTNGGNFFYAELVFQYIDFTGGLKPGTSNSSMVEVASKEIGNINGQPYWSWYGFSYRVEWCACFVSWVADQNGYLDTAVPKFAYVPTGIQWFRNKGQFRSNEYTPVAGDIIFFDWDLDGIGDHVGIVEMISNGMIHTIEGNTANSVARRQYALHSSSVMGFGVPAY
ncbi:lysozyme family protein [Enterococcus faecium]|nr:lysozyme family protein [Enterococcus faecium]